MKHSWNMMPKRVIIVRDVHEMSLVPSHVPSPPSSQWQLYSLQRVSDGTKRQR